MLFLKPAKVEQLENTRIYINKRPGLTEFCNVTGNAVGRGLIYFIIIFMLLLVILFTKFQTMV